MKMRKIQLILLNLLSAALLRSAEFAPKWQLQIPELKKGMVYEVPAAKDRLSVDVPKITGIAPETERYALIRGSIESDQDTSLILGMGADFYYELYLNGDLISSTMATGNPAFNHDIGPHNVLKIVRLKKGSNEVGVRLKSGSQGFRFEMAPAAMTRANFARAVPPEIEEKYSEVIFSTPGSDSIQLHFATTYGAYSELEFREAGQGPWRKLCAAEPAAGLYPLNRHVHRFTLKGLRPGAAYEYRINLTFRRKFQQGPAGKFTFRPNEGKDFSFFVTGDTQFPSEELKKEMLSSRQSLKTDECAFLVHIGDMATFTTSFEKQYFEAFFRPLNAARPERPVVMVRGNHELMGPLAAEWTERFGAEGKRGYYAFRYGQCCFIVLDTGPDKDFSGRWEHVLYSAQRAYLAEERRWLEAYVQSAEFQNAQFRIVLAHAFPEIWVETMADAVKMLTDGLFTGKNPHYPIHLWLAGHTHRYERTLPGTAEAFIMPRAGDDATMRGPWRVPNDPRLVPFTVVVGGGPNGASLPRNVGIRVDCGKTLQVTVRTPDGFLLDKFEIGKDGKLFNGTPSEQLKKIPMLTIPPAAPFSTATPASSASRPSALPDKA